MLETVATSTERLSATTITTIATFDFTAIYTANVDFIALFVSQSELESYQYEFHSDTVA